MKSKNQLISRKKFVAWTMGIFSFSLISISFRFFKKKQSKKLKMLTEDGRLVEVDEAAISARKGKITDIGLQTWVKK